MHPYAGGGFFTVLLTSEGEDGVYACGPELYLACKLGAEIKVKGDISLIPSR